MSTIRPQQQLVIHRLSGVIDVVATSQLSSSTSTLVAKTVAAAGPATNEFTGGDPSKANFIANFVYTMGRFHRYLLIVLGLTTFVLVPMFALLTVSFGAARSNTPGCCRFAF